MVEVEPLIHIHLPARRTMILCTCNSVKKIMLMSSKPRSCLAMALSFCLWQTVHSIKFSVFTIDVCLIESAVIAWPLRIPNKIIKQCSRVICKPIHKSPGGRDRLYMCMLSSYPLLLISNSLKILSVSDCFNATYRMNN